MAVALSDRDKAAVDAALTQQRGAGGWRPTPASQYQTGCTPPIVASWTIDVPTGCVKCASIDHIVVSLDERWPASQLLVSAPQAPTDYSWPHVEPDGKLCLRSTRIECDTVSRVLDSVNWAIDVLNLDELQRREEFHREFLTYWARCSSSTLTYRSLVKPTGPSRMVSACHEDNGIVIAETKLGLERWLTNRFAQTPKHEIFKIPFIWLDCPWIPQEFPKITNDIYNLLPKEFLSAVCFKTPDIPILLGSRTETGPSLVGVRVSQVLPPNILRKFRDFDKIPAKVRRTSAAKKPIERCTVSRIDGEWIHGRDQDSGYKTLKHTRLAFVGCGALGSNLARLVIQAGVGECLFIDNDTYGSHNIYRHVLDHSWIGCNKATALAKQMAVEYPHCIAMTDIPARFEELTVEQLDHLSGFDLVITAGLPLETEVVMSEWRALSDNPIPQVSTWIEPYGIAGHSVAILDGDSLLEKYSPEYKYNYQISNWPDSIRTVVPEAGCGSFFQPHTAAELQLAVNLAYRQVMALVNGRITSSICEVSIGDLDRMAELGGTTQLLQADKFCTRQFQWSE